MPPDPLDVIAESYRGIHESTQVIAQATLQMKDTQVRLEETHRLALRLQAFALTLLGLSLLGVGVLVWQHDAYRHDHEAIMQAVMTNTQSIDAQTRAILERMRQP
jgi:cell division septal protein FtsQ